MNTPPVVFIHSSFRTASTWLWNRFRQNPDVYGFYEIYNGLLGTLRQEDVPRYRTIGWRSNHPDMEPYFLEYAPLLRTDGGVEGYSDTMMLKAFIPLDGINGSIADAERAYVEKLIGFSVAKNRVAVLSDPRSLGRMRSLKRIFGGWHIFSYRSLVRQWLSYLDQARAGNPYFIGTLLDTIRYNLHDDFLRALNNELSLPSCADQVLQDAAAREAVFRAFFGLHIYLYMSAADCADQKIDIGRLARDVPYRAETEETIRLNTGLRVHLGDAKESAIAPFQFSRREIDRLSESFSDLLAEACGCLGRIRGFSAAPFGKALTTATLNELQDYRPD